MITSILVSVVAALHPWFMILEMVFWKKPLGRKTFGMSIEKANLTASLAINQGLYNGFLAASLIASFFVANPTQAAFQLYGLSCVVIAGIVGAITVSTRIFYIQSMPAILALIFKHFQN